MTNRQQRRSMTSPNLMTFNHIAFLMDLVFMTVDRSANVIVIAIVHAPITQYLYLIVADTLKMSRNDLL